MSINSYQGIDQPVINVESADELYEALDILHTQVIDNISDESPLLQILQEAMAKIELMGEQQ